MAQVIGSIIRSLVALRKPIAIICAGLVAVAVWGSIVEPEITPWYFQVLYMALLAIIFGSIVLAILKHL